MSGNHLLAIDQGTTSTRAVVYDARLKVVSHAQTEVPLEYPAPGWVEHDPERLWNSVEFTALEALRIARLAPSEIVAIGLTNQRETALIWDRATGKPVGPAIVWQDRRTGDFCESHASDQGWLSDRTGLVLDPYFTATKWAWLLDSTPGIRTCAKLGRLAAGTVDSWLIWRLTGGSVHGTDVTNASRTLLMDLHTCDWADDLCNFFDVPRVLLPRILPSSGVVGTTRGLSWLPDGIRIAGVAGDQQASLIGQGCVAAGQAKCTYGTGAFLLVHTGTNLARSSHGLVTTAAATIKGQQPQYALEGSVFVAGAAVQWFRDGLRAIGAAPEIDTLYGEGRAESGVVFVPALTGLGAPHWRPEARGTIFGLTRDTTVADLARATIEGVAFQVADLIQAICVDAPTPLAEIRIDGGMARSDPFLQFQADLLGTTLLRSSNSESTALGAALLAGLGIELWPDLSTALELLPTEYDRVPPKRDSCWREQALERWNHAVTCVKHYYR